MEKMAVTPFFFSSIINARSEVSSLETIPHNPLKRVTITSSKGGTSILGGREGLAPKFASKNISDKYSKFCPLNFRYDPKIGTFTQLLHVVVTELPKLFLLLGEVGWTLPQILPLNLM